MTSLPDRLRLLLGGRDLDEVAHAARIDRGRLDAVLRDERGLFISEVMLLSDALGMTASELLVDVSDVPLRPGEAPYREWPEDFPGFVADDELVAGSHAA